MKSTIKFILAAVAVSLALASCAKELLIEENGSSSPSEGTRVIAVSFGQQSKTTLNADGITPEFTGEDEWVMVSNEETGEKCQIITENGVLLFKTNLKGELRAVYPASAAKIEKNIITGITIPATQTGKFADANICMAENITNKAVFDNKTAILKFYVGEEISVNEISITGSKITEGSKTITVSAPDGKHLHEVTDGPDKRICYVAVQAGANANGLQLKSKTTTQGDISRTLTTAATLEAGKMYNAFIPYYIEVNGVKWGYCNVGAFLPEEPGEYFAWGETIGHKWNASENKFDNGYNFNWANTPFNGANASFDQTYFNTTKDIVCPNGTLALKYDAANANWGAGWRMPTQTERKDLQNLSPQVVGGMLTVPNTALKFPFSGCGNGTQMKDSEEGFYWTSSLNNNNNVYVLVFQFRVGYTTFTSGYYRNGGLPIRPVYDENAVLKEPVLLPGEFSVNGDGKKVRFTGGNLYWENNAWKVKNNQCDAGGYFYFSTDAQHSRERNIAGETYSTEDKLFCCEDNSLSINSQEGFFDLSKEEWEYLLKNRSQTNRFARANVNGKQGILIFPDGYQKESEISDVSGIMAVNSHEKSDFPSVKLELYIWSVMESNGVVFLPMTSYYAHGTYESFSPKVAYWSSTANSYEEKKDEAYYLLANTTQVNLIPGSAAKRDFGYQIRLVKKIAQAGK